MGLAKEVYEERYQNWLDGLRSGRYIQGQCKLHQIIDNQHKFCCLGVACEISKVLTIEKDDDEDVFTYEGLSDFLPYKAMEYYGMREESGKFKTSFVFDNDGQKNYYNSLVGMNDEYIPFNVIADAIEQKKHELFIWA